MVWLVERTKKKCELERSGDLDYLVGGEGQHVFHALIALGSVNGGTMSGGARSEE